MIIIIPFPDLKLLTNASNRVIKCPLMLPALPLCEDVTELTLLKKTTVCPLVRVVVKTTCSALLSLFIHPSMTAGLDIRQNRVLVIPVTTWVRRAPLAFGVLAKTMFPTGPVLTVCTRVSPFSRALTSLPVCATIRLQLLNELKASDGLSFGATWHRPTLLLRLDLLGWTVAGYSICLTLNRLANRMAPLGTTEAGQLFLSSLRLLEALRIIFLPSVWCMTFIWGPNGYILRGIP